MKSGEDFLDTNILVYAFAHDQRAFRSKALLRNGCLISVQSLNEFANVARRKLGLSWDDTGAALRAIRQASTRIVSVDLAVHERGIELAIRYGFSIYDAMLVAAALQARCTRFWSEDMHHGLLVENHLRILNPFATPA